MLQKLRVLRLGRIPLVLRGFCVANLCRKTSDFCDEFRDKETETLARTPVSAGGSFKWPLMTRLLGLPQQEAGPRRNAPSLPLDRPRRTDAPRAEERSHTPAEAPGDRSCPAPAGWWSSRVQ
jgi:hypothetical protein